MNKDPKGNETILKMIIDKTFDATVAEKLLDGVDIDGKISDPEGYSTTYIFYAVDENNVDAVEFFLEHGADPNYSDAELGSPLWDLQYIWDDVKEQDVEARLQIAKMFFEHGADPFLPDPEGINGTLFDYVFFKANYDDFSDYHNELLFDFIIKLDILLEDYARKIVSQFDFEDISNMIVEEYCDLNKLNLTLYNVSLSEEQMMELAIRAAKVYELAEIEKQYREIEDTMESTPPAGYYEEFDPKYIENARRHMLTSKLDILLKHGMNPNTRLEDNEEVNVMNVLLYVDLPFLAAYTMRLMLEHGADPNMPIDYSETLFQNIDCAVTFDLLDFPDNMVMTSLQCWFVLIGYGGRLENIEPFELNPGHSYDELKEYEYFEHRVEYNPQRKENRLHIIDRRTGEEIGVL